MKSYWYLTRSNKIPKNRSLIKFVERKNYTLLSFSCEVDKDKINLCDFVYIGYGELLDYGVQVRLMREIQRSVNHADN